MTAPRSTYGVIKAIKAIKAIDTALPVSSAGLEAFSHQVLHNLCLPLNTIRSPSSLLATGRRIVACTSASRCAGTGVDPTTVAQFITREKKGTAEPNQCR